MATRTFHTRSDHEGIVRLKFPVESRDADMLVVVSFGPGAASAAVEARKRRLLAMAGSLGTSGIEAPADSMPRPVESL